MIRRIPVLFLAALLAGAMVLLVPAHRAAAQPGSTAGTSTDVATCLQSARSLSALFLFDRSGSLSTSDANGVRYDGLRLALQSLSRISRPDGQPVTVEVAVSAFDDSYKAARDVVDWTRISSDPSDRKDETADKKIDRVIGDAKKNTQPNGYTNFTAALDGAFGDVKDRGGRGACRVVFWFTDGEDGVNTVGNAPCRADSGVVDEMRKLGIVIVGLQLGPKTDSLHAISMGSSGPVQCGRNPIPSDWATGVYIQADDAAALRRLFGNLGNLLKGCASQGDRRNVIDPGVGGMNITIQTPAQVGTVRLDAPDGTVISAATTGSTTAGGYTVLAQSDPTYTSLAVDFPPGKGAGEWTVSAGQAIPLSAMDFCVYSGLHLARVDPKAAPLAGKPAEIVYQAVDRTGAPAALTPYKDVSLGGAVLGADGATRKATALRRGNQIVLAFSSEATDARVQGKLTAQLTTVTGLALAPLAADDGIVMTLSRDFPTVSPVDQLDLGTAINRNLATKELTLLGSPNGPSQVCFDAPAAITVPGTARGQSLDAPSGCVALAQGETKTVRVGVTPAKPTIGGGEATLPIRLVPVAGSPMAGREALVNLPVIWRYDNPTDIGTLWGVLAAVALVSVLLPLLTLSVVNYVTARFTVSGLRGEVIAVEIGDDGPHRVNPLASDPNRVLDLYETEAVAVPGRREFKYGPLTFSSRVSPWPWIAPTFTARPTTPAGYRVLSTVTSAAGDGTTAPVPPGLGFVVVAMVADADLANPALAVIPAQLVFLSRDDGVASDRLDALMNSRIDWRTITERWRAGVTVVGSDAAGRAGAAPDMGYLDEQPDDYPDSGSMDFLDRT